MAVCVPHHATCREDLRQRLARVVWAEAPFPKQDCRGPAGPQIHHRPAAKGSWCSVDRLVSVGEHPGQAQLTADQTLLYLFGKRADIFWGLKSIRDGSPTLNALQN